MQAQRVSRFKRVQNQPNWYCTQVHTVSVHISFTCVWITRVAGWYQNGCAGARSGRHVDGRRSCTWGIWKVSLQSAVWCGEAGFPSGWRRPHTECSGMASHLKEEKNNPAHLTHLFLFYTICGKRKERKVDHCKLSVVADLLCWVDLSDCGLLLNDTSMWCSCLHKFIVCDNFDVDIFKNELVSSWFTAVVNSFRTPGITLNCKIHRIIFTVFEKGTRQHKL